MEAYADASYVELLKGLMTKKGLTIPPDITSMSLGDLRGLAALGRRLRCALVILQQRGGIDLRHDRLRDGRIRR